MPFFVIDAGHVHALHVSQRSCSGLKIRRWQRVTIAGGYLPLWIGSLRQSQGQGRIHTGICNLSLESGVLLCVAVRCRLPLPNRRVYYEGWALRAIFVVAI